MNNAAATPHRELIKTMEFPDSFIIYSITNIFSKRLKTTQNTLGNAVFINHYYYTCYLSLGFP